MEKTSLKLQAGMILLVMESGVTQKKEGGDRLHLHTGKEYWILSISSHLKAFGASVLKY